MAQTKRNSSAGFPMSLQMVPVGTGELGLHDEGGLRAHNAVISAYALASARGEVRPTHVVIASELAVLALASGINTWVRQSGAASPNRLGHHVTVPLVGSFKSALDGYIGRLDAPTLHDWADDMLRACGFEAETLLPMGPAEEARLRASGFRFLV